MSNVPAKLASAVALSVVVGAAAVALPAHRARAADGCQTEPGDAAAQGKHWHYRIERGTGRHCWYLRGEDEKSPRADAQDAAPPEEKPVAQRQYAATSRSIADAHAEVTSRTSVPDDAHAVAPSVWPNPAPAAATAVAPNSAAAAPADTSVSTGPLASRWPQTSDDAPSNPAAAPANPAPEASQMVADAEPDPNADASPQQRVPPPPVAAAPERNTGSIQKLLLVAFSALALAGLTGSAVYRLGRRRRRDDWLRERTNWQSTENPHNPPWVEPNLARPASQRRDLDELAASQTDFAETMEETEEAVDSDERVEKIEEFLARLTRQLHEEMESTGRAERGARAAS